MTSLEKGSQKEDYIRNLEYIYRFFHQLTPSILQFNLLTKGYRYHWDELNYLELGFGQGLSLAIHAAACPGRFWGNDFNPSHVLQLKEFQQAAETQISIWADSFEELLKRPDLPMFDFIGMHGIWSWVSEKSRQSILELLKTKLRPGGVVYINYNCLPGWSQIAPLRHILKLHAQKISGAKPIPAQVDSAIAFARRLQTAGVSFFRLNPQVSSRLNKIEGQDRTYLAHEYFNNQWQPFFFSEVAESLHEAKLEFIGSTDFFNAMLVAGAPPEIQKLFQELTDPVLTQSVYDYWICPYVRTDLFSQGLRQLSRTERETELSGLRFALLSPESDVQFKIQVPIGEIVLQEAIYRPIIEQLATENYRPKSIAELMKQSSEINLPFEQLIQALAMLVGQGSVHPAQEDSLVAKAAPACQRLNRHFLEKARTSPELTTLASPVLGGGVPVSRFDQLFLSAIDKGLRTSRDLAKHNWGILKKGGELIVQKGTVLRTDEQNLAELERQAKEFQTKILPILKALQVLG